ncbi:MAG: hypothetical protein EAX89_11570 [Candidatus Lokiarchaeota archaeon]|nr:hypothetical protein [Candidatus Lokiarchaeota archaeon]
MESGKLFAILGGILTLVGTYVFAVYGTAGVYAASGIGFIMNIPDLFTNADAIAILLGTQVWLYYILLIIFIVFLAAGVLQIVGMNSKVLSLIFALFPLGVGLMFIFLEYTDFLGIKSLFFALMFAGEHYADFYPIIVNLGTLGLGVYLTLGGGVLGFISVFLPRD